MRIIQSSQKNFLKTLQQRSLHQEENQEKIDQIVKEIIQKVRKEGDNALFDYAKQFDSCRLNKKNLLVSSAEIKQAYQNISKENLKALKLAKNRILKFHQKMSLKSWEINEDEVKTGQRVLPIDRAGIYVPGGLAAYPSSVLMNALAAKAAKVKEIIMVTPFKKNEVNPYVLVAAHLAGVDKIFKVGGAQAVAALAYGTQSIPKVDKIVGPGNAYVATAKKMVFGQVGIDMIAGPSEILVICDGKTNVDWVAADLLSQAEHDVMASSILITWDKAFATALQKRINEMVKTLARSQIASASLQKNGLIIICKNANEAAEISNELAPEHLELSVEKPRQLLPKIKHAGAIFLGRWTTEAFGDYLAGPNHVLPTNGTARFSSPLSTYDFLKFSSIIECNQTSVQRLGPNVTQLALLEGLQAHALAMQLRMK